MWSLLLLGLLATSPPEVEVRTLDGLAVVGTIAEWNADRITIETAEGRNSLDIAELERLSLKGSTPASGESRVCVELVDGSSLLGVEFTVSDGRARLVRADGPLEIPAREITAVRLQPRLDAVADEWSRIVKEEVDSDLLVVRKGDSINYYRGVLLDVTEEVVHFELDGEVLPVKRSKVHGLVLYRPAGRELPSAAFWMTDATGSRWAVRSITLGDDALHIAWTTPTGLAQSLPLGSVVEVDFSSGKIVYLSDMKPESVRWTPYFGMEKELPSRARFFEPRDNQSLEASPLELGGQQYQKGLALHSRARLVYRLAGQFRRFEAIVGIDDRVRPQGNVKLVVRGDDAVLLETTVTGSDPPRHVNLDVTGVRRLVILADFGEDLDMADHLNLCEARVVK